VADETVELRDRVLAAALLCASAMATGVLAYRARNPSVHTLPLLVTSIGGLAIVALVPALRRSVSGLLVGCLMVGVLATALVRAPPAGADMWVYHQMGRTLAEHGDSPYVHPPSDYPDDPWLDRLWLYSDDLAPYGPGYLAVTSTVATIFQESRLGVRLAYQLGAAMAVAACFVLMRRARAPDWCVALCVLNPVLVIEVVGQGRSDAYPALALLIAGLTARRWPHAAAVVIALGALIKLPVVLALAGLCLWVWRRDGFRRGVTVGASGAVPFLLAYAAAGGTVALQGTLDIRNISNGSSVWTLARENGMDSVLGGDLGARLGPVGSLASVAMVAAVLLAAILLLPRLFDRHPDAVLGTPLLAYLLVSAYPTARYFMWILPVFLLRPWAKQATVVIAQSMAILVTTLYAAALLLKTQQDALDPGAALDDRAFRVFHGLPVVLALLAIAWLVVDALTELRRRASSQPVTEAVLSDVPA